MRSNIRARATSTDTAIIVNVRSLDLNLLPVLDAVLLEGNATRAAARLGLTQPAISNALARLRKVLGDPLFVKSRRGLVPTPRALELRPELSQASLRSSDGIEGSNAIARAVRREAYGQDFTTSGTMPSAVLIWPRAMPFSSKAESVETPPGTVSARKTRAKSPRPTV
jgi:DNA-binding transcriptional LysR family regulator